VGKKTPKYKLAEPQPMLCGAILKKIFKIFFIFLLAIALILP